MDRRGLFFFLGGASALLFYLGLIFVLILFLNDRHHTRRYVPKKSQSIEVAIMSAPPSRPKAPSIQHKIAKPPSVKPKTPAAAKETPPPAKKSRATRPHRAIASLFKGVKVPQPVNRRPKRLANAPKLHYKPKKSRETSSRRAEALIKDLNLSKPRITMVSKAGGQGEVNAYMSKLYDILYSSWQPSSLYAGLTAKVRLHIAPDGSFTYRMLYPSDNQGFNESLIEYLDTIQKKGLPPLKKGGPLTIDVQFKAKE